MVDTESADAEGDQQPPPAYGSGSSPGQSNGRRPGDRFLSGYVGIEKMVSTCLWRGLIQKHIQQGNPADRFMQLVWQGGSPGGQRDKLRDLDPLQAVAPKSACPIESH